MIRYCMSYSSLRTDNPNIAPHLSPAYYGFRGKDITAAKSDSELVNVITEYR